MGVDLSDIIEFSELIDFWLIFFKAHDPLGSGHVLRQVEGLFIPKSKQPFKQDPSVKHFRGVSGEVGLLNKDYYYYYYYYYYY